MEPSNSNGGRESRASQTLTPASLNLLSEGISLVLSRWTALQMAIENQLGGPDSRQKSSYLVTSILDWFSNSNGPPCISDLICLEIMLGQVMTIDFHTYINDGSEKAVAKELTVIYEDCLKGNYESIDKLRKSVPAKDAVSHSKVVIIEDEDEDEDEGSDEEASEMMVGELVNA